MRWRAVAGGVTLACAAVAPLLGAQVARAATPGTPQLTVHLDAIEPRVLTPTGTLSLSGTVTGTVQAGNLHVTLYSGATVSSRLALRSLEAAPATVKTLPNRRVAQTVTQEDVRNGRTVKPGRTTSFRVQVPVSALHLTASRVSALEVLVAGDHAASGYAVSFLPYFPDTVGGAPAVSLVIPVTSQPDSLAPTEALAREVATGGRLDTAVKAAQASRPDSTHKRPSAVTLAVDPALLPRAPTVLAALKALHGTPGVVLQGLPDADADLDALAAAGNGPAVRQRVVAAAASVDQALGVDDTTEAPLLPPDGLITKAALSASGEHSVVVDSTLYPVDPQTTIATPSALVAVDTTSRALVTDATLQTMLLAADKGADTPREAEQDFLAETAMIAAEAPNATPARALVLEAPRDWAASADWAAHIVRDLAAVPWLTPTPLAALAAGTPVGRPGALPTVDPSALPADGIHDGDNLRKQASTVASLLGDQAVRVAVNSTVDLSESSYWRDSPQTASALRAGAAKSMSATLAGVTLDSSSSVLITGSSGKVPFTLTNSLPQKVTVVVRLRVPPGSRIEAASTKVPIESGSVHRQYTLTVTSHGAGRFPVTLELAAPDGTTLGKPIQLTVRSGNYGVFAVAITCVALGVLLIALIFRGTRGLLRWRAKRGPEPLPGRHRVTA